MRFSLGVEILVMEVQFDKWMQDERGSDCEERWTERDRTQKNRLHKQHGSTSGYIFLYFTPIAAEDNRQLVIDMRAIS